VSSAICRWRWH